MTQKDLVEALSRLKQTLDFQLVMHWLNTTRSEYLSIWRGAEKRLEHMQGRYCGIDDILVVIEHAEESLKKIREREKADEHSRANPF
jgi:CO dehydrogenase nickel-insertion accessory protein CooC1